MRRLKTILAVIVGAALVIAPVMPAFAQGEGETLIQLCHYLPDGTQVQLMVPDSSVPSHQAHGDFLGDCDGYVVNEHPMVEICHQLGRSGNVVTLLVDLRSLPPHLAHGDTIGPCSF